MSLINYVQQVNLFMEYARRNRLTSYERVLFLALFHVANTWAQRAENHEWPDVFFQVSNSELHEWSGLEERAIRNTRNSLKQRGLIDFRKGDGKRSDPEYRINYLRVSGYRIEPTGEEDRGGIGDKYAADSAGGSVGDSVGDTVGGPVGGPVGDPVCIGDRYAADGDSGLYGSTYNHSTVRVNNNINIKTGSKANARTREPSLVDIGCMGAFEGLVPMTGEGR